jgi:hypothetical protein
MDDSWIEFHNLARDPNSHARKLSFLGNHSPHILGHGSGPPQATAGSYAHPFSRTYVYSTTIWPYSYLLCRTYSHTSVHVCNKNHNSSGGVSPLAEPIRYKAYRVPYLRYVASTFKHLTTTTTHCGLIKLINTDGVPFQIRVLHTIQSVILIVIAK